MRTLQQVYVNPNPPPAPVSDKPKFNFWNWVTGEYQASLQDYYSRRQSEEAYQRNLEQWNRENAYNSPVAQMARYQEAGLNPNLIYSQGNSGNASSMPGYQPAPVHQRPSGMEVFQKIASVISTMIGLKGQLASADAAAARAKSALAMLPKRLALSDASYWSALGNNPLAYFKLVEGSDWSASSPSELLQGDPGLFLAPGFSRALKDEWSYNFNQRYQGEMQEAQIARLRWINSLLRQQDQFYKWDKYIGYGTDLLGSLLSVGNFGLGVGRYNVFKNRLR